MWNGYSETKNQRSILKALEKNSDQLRSNYLTFIKDLGQICVRDKMVVEHLMIEKGFSLWWMSMLAEKGTLKSKVPFNCLKLLALNQILIEEKLESVELITNSQPLANSLSAMCTSLNIVFNWTKPLKHIEEFNIKNIWRKLPHLIQAPVFLMRNIYAHWSLRKSLDTNWFDGNNTVFFFSYFLNLDRDALNNGKFLSNYWSTLPELIKQSGKKINWIHHFMVSVDVPDTKTGIKYLKEFNEDATNQGQHNFLYSFLTLNTVAKAIALWLSIVFKASLIQRTIDRQVYKISKGWLWPLVREDWKSSVYGKVAIENIILIYILDKFMSSLPKQQTGLYLCENQGWERAFIHYWKKYGHGELIGVAHSAIRYWDLRYYDDPQVLESKDPLAQPLPDKIALNGPAAFKAFRDANQPMNRFEKVEAIRYQYLGFNKGNNYSGRSISEKKTLLILGDYNSIASHQMLGLLNCFNQADLLEYEIIFKPHPATHISLDGYKIFSVKEDNAHLEKLLPKTDVVISSGNTVASVEAWLLGLPVIIVLDDNSFNLSPLRGEKSIKFVSSRNELVKALKKMKSSPRNHIDPEGFFWFNSDLLRWQKLLSS